MPIYEFRCAACDQRFEKLCPLGETGEHVTCPNCGKPYPRRVMSGFSTRARGGNGGLELSGHSGGCKGCSSSSCATCRH